MTEWTPVGSVEGPPLRAVLLGETEIALARLEDGSWAAFDNACTHEECPLSDGDLDAGVITCYCHSSAFDVFTGDVLDGPAEDPLRVYPVRVVDGELQLGVE